MSDGSAEGLIDCHMHAWNRRILSYPWMDSEELPAISRVPSRDDLEAAGTRAVILVEAGVEVGMRDRETDWMIAQIGDDVVGVIAAAGWRDASLPVPRPGIVGVRVNILGAAGISDTATRLAETCEKAARAGWPVDVLCAPAELELVARTLESVEDAVLVIDHLGRPPVEDGWRSAAAGDWLRGLVRVSRHAGARVKISGPGGRAADFVAAAIDLFGIHRCVLGSDWPMERAGDYAERIEQTLSATGGRLDRALAAATARFLYAVD